MKKGGRKEEARWKEEIGGREEGEGKVFPGGSSFSHAHTHRSMEGEWREEYLRGKGEKREECGEEGKSSLKSRRWSK